MKIIVTRFFISFFSFILVFMTACVRERSIKNYSGKSPIMNLEPNMVKLDFNQLHNYVIEHILSQMTPFFYINDNTFIIDGSNNEDNKFISINATCDNEATIHDVDLFLSLVLYYIGEDATEDFDIFKVPTISSNGEHLDFGTVFNYYDLKINIIKENGDKLVDEYIYAGDKIPVEPKYWSEDTENEE